MNDAKHDNIRVALMELLLSQLEGRKSTKEVLIKAVELCQKNVSDKDISKVSKRLLDLRNNYDQGIITDSEAIDEITNILLLLAK